MLVDKRLLLLALLPAQAALGGLYPTNPVANTVWSAGRMTKISWVDDGTLPTLAAMGPLSIELWQADMVSRSVEVRWC